MKPKIILADQDEGYLEELEYKFLAELGDTAEFEFFTDIESFAQYLESPRTAEILAVSEDMYLEAIQKQDFAHVYILAAGEDGDNPAAGYPGQKVFRFSGVKEIYFALTSASREILGRKDKEKGKQLFVFFSAAGGSGKTFLALSMASALVSYHRKVLFISTEAIPGFQSYLKDPSGLPKFAFQAMLKNPVDVYQAVKPYLRKEGFTYLPPMLQLPGAWDLDDSVFTAIVDGARKSGEYDFIVVDVESVMMPESRQLLLEADKAMMVLRTDAVSLAKTRILINNMEIRERGKYMLLFNGCGPVRGGLPEENEFYRHIDQREFIPFLEGEVEGVKEMGEIREMKNLAYLYV